MIHDFMSISCNISLRSIVFLAGNGFFFNDMQEFFATFSPAFPELALIAGIVILSFGFFWTGNSQQKTTGSDSYLNSNWFQKYNISLVFVQLLLVAILFLTGYQKKALNAIPGMRIIGDPNMREATFSGLFIMDGFIRLVKMILLTWMLLFITIISKCKYINISLEELLCSLSAVLGAMLAVSADDFLLMFLGLEILSVSSVLFIKLNDDSNPDIPFKIFSIYSIGIGLFLIGCALLYNTVGTTDCSLLVNYLLDIKPNFQNFSPFPLLAFFFIVMGLLTKMIFVPFHGISVNIAEKSKMHIFVFLSFSPRFVCLVLIVRIFTIFNLGNFNIFLLCIGLFGMIIGYLNTSNQNQIKNILACEVIGNTGILLIGLAVSSLHIIPCMLFFIIIEALTFLIYLGNTLYMNNYGRHVTTLNDLCFIKYESPSAALILGGCVLCFAGLPPFPGFLPLVMLAQNMIIDGAYITLLITFLFKIVSIGNGVRVLNALFVKNAVNIAPNIQIGKQKKMTKLSFVIFAMCCILGGCMIKADTLLDVFTMAESALRCYTD